MAEVILPSATGTLSGEAAVVQAAPEPGRVRASQECADILEEVPSGSRLMHLLMARPEDRGRAYLLTRGGSRQNDVPRKSTWVRTWSSQVASNLLFVMRVQPLLLRSLVGEEGEASNDRRNGQ